MAANNREMTYDDHLHIKVQSSLKSEFMDACEREQRVPSGLLRNFMAEYVAESKKRKSKSRRTQ